MSSIDSLLKPISDDNPCGEDLEYEPLLSELRTEVEGRPESQVGEDVIEAKEADWPKVKELGIELLGRSKNLEVAAYLCVAGLATEGLAGFGEGMEVLEGMISQFWDELYPKLDPEESEEERYIERFNILEALSRPAQTFEDTLKVVERLRQAPLCESREVGSFSLEDIVRAQGGESLSEGEAEDKPAPTLALIEAGFRKSESDVLQSRAQAVTESLKRFEAIGSYLKEALGNGAVPNFENVKQQLKEIAQAIQTFSVGGGLVGEDAGGAPGETAGVSSGVAASGQAALSGAVTSRQDVNKALDKIVEYYNRYEPSSPVPFLLQRARRLVNSNFIEIVRNFTPDYEQEFNKILDIPEEES